MTTINVRTTISILCVAVTLCLEASCARVLPEIRLQPGADKVHVAHTRAEVPTSCLELGLVSESDGIISSDRTHYDGTVERARLRVLNRAFLMGANFVREIDKDDAQYGSVIVQDVAVDCGHCGIVVWVHMLAYSCR